MAVFGWLCIVAIAVIISCGTASIVLGSAWMSGKLGVESWIFIAVAAVLWFVVWWLCPFKVVMA